MPNQIMPWLYTLKALSRGSSFLFPTRRSGKKGYISDDTLNHALANLFDKKTGKARSSTGNVLGAEGIKHFVIHDLRRTCRTLLESLGIDERVAEKSLNHKLKGVIGVYNQYGYFNERKEAIQMLADKIFPLIENSAIYTPDKKS